jgi:hypothetical protein
MKAERIQSLQKNNSLKAVWKTLSHLATRLISDSVQEKQRFENGWTLNVIG